MGAGSDAFGRTAEAILALAAHDSGGYAVALAAIVGDIEQRTERLTGVAVADTALMLEVPGRPAGDGRGDREPGLAGAVSVFSF